MSLPTPEELSEAIDARNGALIAKFALSIQQQKNIVAETLPDLIERQSNATRDLNVAKAAIKNCVEQIKLCQSVLKEIRSPY